MNNFNLRKFLSENKLTEYEKESFNWTQEIEEDFVAWIIDGNAIKNPDGTYSTQDSMYKNRLASIDELKRYFYKEYLR